MNVLQYLSTSALVLMTAVVYGQTIAPSELGNQSSVRKIRSSDYQLNNNLNSNLNRSNQLNLGLDLHTVQSDRRYKQALWNNSYTPECHSRWYKSAL